MITRTRLGVYGLKGADNEVTGETVSLNFKQVLVHVFKQFRVVLNDQQYTYIASHTFH